MTAETLYEAVAQALGILRCDIWVEEIGELGRRHEIELVGVPVIGGLSNEFDVALLQSANLARSPNEVF